MVKIPCCMLSCSTMLYLSYLSPKLHQAIRSQVVPDSVMYTLGINACERGKQWKGVRIPRVLVFVDGFSFLEVHASRKNVQKIEVDKLIVIFWGQSVADLFGEVAFFCPVFTLCFSCMVYTVSLVGGSLLPFVSQVMLLQGGQTQHEVKNDW